MKPAVIAPVVWIFAVMAMMGCTGGELDVQSPSLNPNATINGAEVAYLGEGFDRGATQTGYHEMIPDKPFRGVSFMLTSPVPWSEFSVQRADGTWTDFQPMGFQWNYRKFQNDYLEFEEPVTGFRLRFDDPTAEFLRLEFHDQPVGVADPYDDTPGDGLEEDPAPLINGLAKSGRWAVPASVAEVAGRQRVSYDRAPPWRRSNCAGTFKSGAKALGDFLTDNFRGARYFQGYNCRRINGGRGMSMHGTGRAIDVFVPLDRGKADNDLGDEIGNFLLMNAEELGVQMVIWDRTIWTRRRGVRRYNGAHPHHDHLHIEVTKDAARRTRINLRRSASGAAAPPAPAAPEHTHEPVPRTPAPEPEPASEPEPAPEPEPNQPDPAPAPQPAPSVSSANAWIGTECISDAECGFTAGGARGFCWTFEDADGFTEGFCSLPCEGLCPDKIGEAYTFCVAVESPTQGMCVSRSATQNNYCADIEGTVPTDAMRHVGTANVVSRQRTVCLP